MALFESVKGKKTPIGKFFWAILVGIGYSAVLFLGICTCAICDSCFNTGCVDSSTFDVISIAMLILPVIAGFVVGLVYGIAALKQKAYMNELIKLANNGDAQVLYNLYQQYDLYRQYQRKKNVVDKMELLKRAVQNGCPEAKIEFDLIEEKRRMDEQLEKERSKRQIENEKIYFKIFNYYDDGDLTITNVTLGNKINFPDLEGVKIRRGFKEGWDGNPSSMDSYRHCAIAVVTKEILHEFYSGAMKVSYKHGDRYAENTSRYFKSEDLRYYNSEKNAYEMLLHLT
ncbi:MAG: hypothetical protein FWD47_13520 [Treponema sp.]|nr:hypothetical protein [Treponema sp.]